MPRAARRRLWTQAACYHVLNRGHARETVFHDDVDHLHFLRLLARYRDRFDLRLYHYCLMSNHFHLLLQVPDASALSRLMAGLLVAYWHHYRRRYGLVGHLFQGRFRSPASRQSVICSVADGMWNAIRSKRASSQSHGSTAGRVAEPMRAARWMACWRSTLGSRDWQRKRPDGRRCGASFYWGRIRTRQWYASRIG